MGSLCSLCGLCVLCMWPMCGLCVAYVCNVSGLCGLWMTAKQHHTHGVAWCCGCSQERLAFWKSLTFPFGSEMSWDNTGETHTDAGASTRSIRAGASVL